MNITRSVFETPNSWKNYRRSRMIWEVKWLSCPGHCVSTSVEQKLLKDSTFFLVVPLTPFLLLLSSPTSQAISLNALQCSYAHSVISKLSPDKRIPESYLNKHWNLQPLQRTWIILFCHTSSTSFWFLSPTDSSAQSQTMNRYSSGWTYTSWYAWIFLFLRSLLICAHSTSTSSLLHLSAVSTFQPTRSERSRLTPRNLVIKNMAQPFMPSSQPNRL